ncbi:hypothetical protein ENSA7_50560 [Enhygromyxa salina]|uniref:Uncharacterized protein n=2 Tax=Enhygromyxa salina TaxID=215803 RepID=A0A2S9YIE2_9BACT|nr:hypothetical protein ENSA7_50560 [Enhygromyxa salina]
MLHTSWNHHTLPQFIVLTGIIATLGQPAVSDASPSETHEITSTPAATDAPREQAVLGLKIDTWTGDAYLITATGDVLIDDGELNVCFGTLSAIVLDLEFTSTEWEVEVSPTGESTQSYYTSGGALRLSIVEDPDEYVLAFTEVTSYSSTMMTVVPNIPVVVVKPDRDCPHPP